MRNHIRTDTFKIFPEDDSVMNQIKLEHNLPENLWKSTSIRIALIAYRDKHKLTEQVQLLSDQVESQNDKLEEILLTLKGRGS